MSDPDGAIERRAQNGAAAARDDVTGRRARKVFAQATLPMRVVQEHALAQHFIAHAGESVRRADLAQDGRRIIGAPVDRAVGLRHRGPLPAAHAGVRIVERLRLSRRAPGVAT